MADVEARGWPCVDFVYVTGDAYVDHPSFGLAIISRVLEASGLPFSPSRIIKARRIFAASESPVSDFS